MIEPEIIPPADKPKRPAEFSDEIFQEVCDRMAGGEGLRKICEDPQMPSRQTFLRWIEKDSGRQARYTAAREALMDWYAEEILTIAWDSSRDTIPADGKKPARCDNEWVNRSRLKVDTLKFLMAKLHPKRYGDKTPELLAMAVPEQTAGLSIKWQEPVRVIVYPMLRDDGSLIPKDTSEYDAAIERAANEARARGVKDVEIGIDLKGVADRPPAQLTYQPEPLPGGLSEDDWSLMGEVLRL